MIRIVFFIFFASLVFARVDKGRHVQTFPWKDARTPVRIVTVDHDGNGKPELVEKYYEDRKNDRLIKRVEKDGKHHVTFTPLGQLAEAKECNPLVPSAPTELSAAVDRLNLGLVEGFLPVSSGQKVHQSCLDKWGRQNFIEIVEKASKDGLACLDRLGAQPVENVNKAAEVAKGLRELWAKKDNQVKIVCNDDSRASWNRVHASASTESDAVLQNQPKVTHPYVSVNPSYPPIPDFGPEAGKEFMSTIVFHEMIHNLGHRHGEGLELTYGCETCCDVNAVPEEKAIACRVCVGDYKDGANDKKYIEDMVAWEKTEGIPDFIARNIIENYMSETGDRRFGTFKMIEVQPFFSTTSSGIAKELASQIPEAQRTPEEQEAIMRESFRRTYAPALPYIETGDAIGKMIVAQYKEDNTTKAVNLLIKNKEKFKELVAKKNLTTLPENERFVVEDTYKSLKTIAETVWMDDYPEQTEDSRRAFRVMREIGILD